MTKAGRFGLIVGVMVWSACFGGRALVQDIWIKASAFCLMDKTQSALWSRVDRNAMLHLGGNIGFANFGVSRIGNFYEGDAAQKSFAYQCTE